MAAVVRKGLSEEEPVGLPATESQPPAGVRGARRLGKFGLRTGTHTNPPLPALLEREGPLDTQALTGKLGRR